MELMTGRYYIIGLNHIAFLADDSKNFRLNRIESESLVQTRECPTMTLVYIGDFSTWTDCVQAAETDKVPN